MDDKNRKIGLALSGGGYKGAAHIGVLKALEELNIKPDLLSGTSAGAIVGSMYAAGYHWKEILKFFKESDVMSIRNYTFYKAGILDSAKYEKLFSHLFTKDSFESLKTPLYITTTDLLEARTKYFYTGELIRPLIASCAIPGVFSPVSINGMLLCDGGVTNNLPTEPLLPLSDLIIGINVSPLRKIEKSDLTTTKEVVQRSYYIIREKQSERNIKDCNIIISPPKLYKFNVFSKSNLDEIFELGYVEAMNQISEYMEKK